MSKRGENIYKRKDGRWEGRYIKSRSPSGKVIYGYVYGRTYRETKGKLVHKIISPDTISVNREKTESAILFQTVAEEWQLWIQPTIKESTKVKYKNILNSYILPVLGSQSLDSITYELIETYCNQLLLAGGTKGKGLSPKTVSDTLSLVRNILKYATTKKVTSVCDISAITIKQVKKEIYVFSRNEQQQLCKYLHDNLTECNLGILFCLFTGLRIGEICALLWEDISISEKTVYVHQTMQRLQTNSSDSAKTKVIVTTPKSSSSIRKIPIPEEMLLLLAKRKGTHTGYFLTNSQHKYLEPRTMQNHFKRILQNCAIPHANFHTLRHTFATRCIEVGFDVKSLSEILGHANVNITMNRYVHPSMDLKRENMQKLSSLFNVR